MHGVFEVGTTSAGLRVAWREGGQRNVLRSRAQAHTRSFLRGQHVPARAAGTTAQPSKPDEPPVPRRAQRLWCRHSPDVTLSPGGLSQAGGEHSPGLSRSTAAPNGDAGANPAGVTPAGSLPQERRPTQGSAAEAVTAVVDGLTPRAASQGTRDPSTLLETLPCNRCRWLQSPSCHNTHLPAHQEHLGHGCCSPSCSPQMHKASLPENHVLVGSKGGTTRSQPCQEHVRAPSHPSSPHSGKHLLGVKNTSSICRRHLSGPQRMQSSSASPDLSCPGS